MNLTNSFKERMFVVRNENETQNKKRKKFNLFDVMTGNRTSKKDAGRKDMESPRNLKFFFKLLGMEFSRFFHVNLMFIIGNFPIVFLLIGFAGFFNDTAVAARSSLFPAVVGMTEASVNPLSAALFGVHGTQLPQSVQTTTTLVFFILGALLLFTLGPVTCGLTRILRSVVKGEPVFFFHDFFETIKKNWRQALIMGFLDGVFLIVIVYDILFFKAQVDYSNSSFFSGIMFWGSIFIAFCYLIMRMYIYPMLITFKLSIPKIIKNAFVFTFLGLGRNVLALLGIICVIIFNFMIAVVFLPLGIILPMVLTIGIIMYIMTYAAWPKIDEVMIKPYYHPDGTPRKENDVE